MNELQRLAYLEAMDIDSYVSRVALPGAAPSRRLRVIRRPQAAVSAAAPSQPPPTAVSPQAPPQVDASAALKASLAPTARDKPQPRAPANTAAGRDIPVFSLAATAAGGCFWLEEVPLGREVTDAYSQLLQAMCAALGLAEQKPELELFNWPLNTSSHLEQGTEAARGAVLGYLSNRLERCQPRAVILLGDIDQPWFDPACLGERQQLPTVSGWQMLRNPALKAQAWADLQALRSHSG
ncbi:MAG: hypothetical protein ABJ308_10400 [Halieaceae bacterium]